VASGASETSNPFTSSIDGVEAELLLQVVWLSNHRGGEVDGRPLPHFIAEQIRNTEKASRRREHGQGH
jgi:hypothetical protein